MARFTRLDVLNTMIETGVVPLFHHPDPETAKDVVGALARGGARIIEFTNRGDHALEVFVELEKYTAEEYPDVILGVGSVIDPPTAAAFINAGANFVVCPSLDADLVRLCNRRKVGVVPGCATTTEIVTAHELGCEIVKAFPGGQLGGPGFVKAVRGPIPSASIMPTGGVDVTEESLSGWFAAGVVCVGIGSKLVRKDLIEAGDWDTLEQAMADVVTVISALR